MRELADKETKLSRGSYGRTCADAATAIGTSDEDIESLAATHGVHGDADFMARLKGATQSPVLDRIKRLLDRIYRQVQEYSERRRTERMVTTNCCLSCWPRCT